MLDESTEDDTDTALFWFCSACSEDYQPEDGEQPTECPHCGADTGARP